MKQVILPELEYVLFHTLAKCKDGATGYDMNKFIGEIFGKWSHQQIYRTMNRHNGDLWKHSVVPQEGKPDKKVYQVSVSEDVEVVSNPQDYSVEVMMFVRNPDDIAEKLLHLKEVLSEELALAEAMIKAGNKVNAAIANHRANMLQAEILVLSNL